jgi:glycosyltransferase involved in cell wall biosynthesis
MKPTVLAILSVRNEQHYLPSLLKLIGPHMPILVVDDASNDATASILAASPHVARVHRHTDLSPTHYRESENRKILFDMAADYTSEQPWLLCMDADERLDDSFLKHMSRLCFEAEQDGIFKIAVHLREMWTPNYYRIDGIWGTKRKVILFKLPLKFTSWPEGVLHHPWPPPELHHAPELLVRANMYHLRMITPEQRTARREKFQQIDSDHFQAYVYLDDERDALLESMPDGYPPPALHSLQL